MAHHRASGYDSAEEVQESMEYFSKKERMIEFNQRLVIAMIVADPTHHIGPKGKYNQPFSWADHLSMLTPRKSTDRYRLTPHGFDIISELVKRKLETADEARAKNSRGESNARKYTMNTNLIYIFGSPPGDPRFYWTLVQERWGAWFATPN